MQIQEFPRWFREMEKKLLTEKVSTIFSSLDRTVSLFIELSIFFGILYQDRIKSLLNHTVKKGEEEAPHSEQVLRIYLKCVEKSKEYIGPTVISQVTILLDKAKLYDHLPRYSDVWACALQEMTEYILSWSMPLQESRLRNCYTFEWIKIKIDAEELEYQNLIMTLFQIKPHEEPPEISQVDELRLYRRTALKIYGKNERSWAAYLCSWLKNKDPYSPLLNRIKSSSFFKILVNSGFSVTKKIEGFNQNNSIIVSNEQKPISKYNSLKEDLFLDTVDNLCKSFLPKSDYFKKKLWRLFESSLPIDRSDHTRHTIMHYIYYLEQNYAQDQSETFFKNGLDVLNRQVPDGDGLLYDFLHGLLHYFNCLNQGTDPKAKDFLYKSIVSIKLVDRKKYDAQIKEFFKEKRFSRQKFKIDSSLLNFVNNHTLTFRQWGNIILRFSRSTAPGPPCPFLDPELHLKLVDETEQLTGLLPGDMVFDLLYFQMFDGSGHVFEILTQFSTLRDLIITKYLDEISLPSELYSRLEGLSGHFLGEFTSTLSLDICKLSDRSNIAVATYMGVANLLSVTTYPKSSVTFCELIPQQIKDKQLIFPEIVLNQVINYQRPVHPSYNPGPTWLVRWEFNEVLNRHEMLVIVENPLKNHMSCSFRLPIKIPILNEEKSIQFCKLLASSVDGLGKEVLSEEEENKSRKLKLTIKERTSSTPIHGTPQKKFEQHMEFSPLVKYEFETMSQKEEESQLDEIKKDLFDFIESLRTNFLRSFYFVLNPMQRTESFLNSGIQVILPSPGGFCLSSALSLVPKIKILNSEEKLHIKNSDYTDKFREIYQAVWDEEKPPRIHKDTFILYFYADDVKKFPVSLQIDNLYLDDEIEQEDKIVQISMTLEDDKKPYSLTIKRPLFKDEKEFQEFMLWQIAVVCNDNKEDWLWKF